MKDTTALIIYRILHSSKMDLCTHYPLEQKIIGKWTDFKSLCNKLFLTTHEREISKKFTLVRIRVRVRVINHNTRRQMAQSTMG